MSGRSSENLNRMGSVASKSFTEADSSPFTDLDGVGLDISNNDAVTDLKFEIIRVQKPNLQFRVPAGATLNDLFPPFTSVVITQTTTSFDLIVREPLPAQ